MRTEDPSFYWKFWKSLNLRNVTTGPTVTNFVNYFEQQVYPLHVDYFDYEHMNNIIKQVTSFLHDSRNLYISASFDQDQGVPVDTLVRVYLLFVNDLVLFSESAEGLQKQLTVLYSYASLWHIIVSISKTNVLIFNERYTKVCGSFHYGDNIIEKAEQYIQSEMPTICYLS